MNTIKIPEFWESSAAAWFSTVEAQFTIRKIDDDETRYCYVVAHLGNSVASRLTGHIAAPPRLHKYVSLKALLLKTFELSAGERARRLFAINGLGDGKPSELMERMLNLLGEEQPCFLFMELFRRNLPAEVRVALANTTVDEPRALAEVADQFFLAVQHPSPGLLAPAVSSAPLVYRPASRGSAGTQDQRGATAGLCFFHTRFGAKAKQCRSPCNFNQAGNGGAGAR